MGIGIGDKVYIKNWKELDLTRSDGICRGFILAKGSSMANVPGYGVGPAPGSKIACLIVAMPDPNNNMFYLEEKRLPLKCVTLWTKRPETQSTPD